MPKHISSVYVYNISMEKLKLVMTGGGTGGHIVPNLALIPYLKKHFKIFYLGEKDSMEQRLVSKDKDITFVEIPAVKLIRKLTPKECWRLMGFTDEDYQKASQVSSESQLYKQAGNSIVVNVLEAIFKQMVNDE